MATKEEREDRKESRKAEKEWQKPAYPNTREVAGRVMQAAGLEESPGLSQEEIAADAQAEYEKARDLDRLSGGANDMSMVRPSMRPHKDFRRIDGSYFSYRLYEGPEGSPSEIEIIEVPGGPRGKHGHLLNTFPKSGSEAYKAIDKVIKGGTPQPTGDGDGDGGGGAGPNPVTDPDPDPAASVDVNVEATTPEGDVDIREILQSFPKQMERQDQREAVKQSFPRKLERTEATSSLGLPLEAEVDEVLALEDQTTPSSENRTRDDLSQAAGRTAKTAVQHGVYNLANMLANARIAALGGLEIARMPGDAAVSTAKQVGEEALEAGEGFLKGYRE